MKILSSMAILLCVSTSLFAGIKIPKHVYKITDLEEAKKQGKPIAFVYTDPSST